MTIKDFSILTLDYSKQKQIANNLKLELESVNDVMFQLEQKILASMSELSLSKYSIEGVGTVYLQNKLSVKTPNTEEDKAAFYGHLKEIGQYDALMSVNSQTLQAWYKAQLETAQIDGQGIPHIPGLTEITSYQQVVLRKG